MHAMPHLPDLGLQSPAPAAPPSKAVVAFADDAAQAAVDIMGSLVGTCSRNLYDRELKARTVHERDALIVSGKLLKGQEARLRSEYGACVREAILVPRLERKRAPQSLSALSLDQLELMDENQVQESVVLARAQQSTLLVADAALNELNTLVSTALGLPVVRADLNPLQPQAFVVALKTLLDRLPVPPSARQDWFATMSEALGAELRNYYARVVRQLKERGVTAAGYAAPPSVGAPPSGVHPVLGPQTSAPARAATAAPPAPGGWNWGNAPAEDASDPMAAPGMRHAAPQSFAPVHVPAPLAAAPRAPADPALLNLDMLRRLLAGELDNSPVSQPAPEPYAVRFSREFEAGESRPAAPASDFVSTVPAAFEALSEMRQVDRVVQQLQQRQSFPGAPLPDEGAAASIDGVRATLRRHARGVAQALSLEVVQLMVDNLARDPRLLPQVQALVRSLEPALLRLSLVDPRFFSDKQHPARELLLQITQRSLAFPKPDTPGLEDFLAEVRQRIDPLLKSYIGDGEPFQLALDALQQGWANGQAQREQDQAQVVAILQHAEARNQLAQRIARKVEAHPDAAKVAAVVVDFLCGPWAQVVAHARLMHGAGSKQASKFEALISALLWSVHPELTKNNAAKLTRLVPMLLSTMRAGLDTIQYPATKTSAFFESLMLLHQRAFQQSEKTPSTDTALAGVSADEAPVLTHEQAGVGRHAVQEHDPWLAPQEAQASNFMDCPQESEATAPAALQEAPLLADMALPQEPESVLVESAQALEGLPLGTWIEAFENGQWQRLQLTWASPHGTLFVFTSGAGTVRSMTRRSRDRLVEGRHLRVLSARAVVEGALNAVAQTAARNSVGDTGLGAVA